MFSGLFDFSSHFSISQDLSYAGNSGIAEAPPTDVPIKERIEEKNHESIASKLSSQEFRRKSATKKRSSDLKNSPPHENQQSTHKIPNLILAQSYNSTNAENQKKDLLGFAHSSTNILYSKNNKSHSKQERSLEKEYKSSSKTKEKSILKGLEKLHKDQKSAATSTTMRQLQKAGPGYTQVVANADKRKFNLPSEKKQIDIARRQKK